MAADLAPHRLDVGIHVGVRKAIDHPGRLGLLLLLLLLLVGAYRDLGAVLFEKKGDNDDSSQSFLKCS